MDLREVTTWALFGAYDWNARLCDRAGFSESGAFDLRFRPLRLTAMGQALTDLARHGRLDHPVLARSGWWRSPQDRSDPGRDRPLLAVTAPLALHGLLSQAAGVRRLDLAIGLPGQALPAAQLGRLVIRAKGFALAVHWQAARRPGLWAAADDAARAGQFWRRGGPAADARRR